MRYLVILTAALAAIYGGYWFFGSAAVERGAERLAADLREDGWQVAYERLNTRGFPSRFDTTVTELALASPGDTLKWEAPFFQVLALSYRPNEVIAVWPPQQTLRMADLNMQVMSDNLRASASVWPGPALAIDQATLEGDEVSLALERGSITVKLLLAAMRPASGAENSYDLYAKATDLILDEMLLPQGADMPRRIETIGMEATARLDRPLDRAALEAAPRLEHLEISDIDLRWGEVTVSGEGRLDFGPGGPSGQIDLLVENWRAALDLAQAAELIDADTYKTAGTALGLLAFGGSSLKLPLTVADGMVSLGPVPLGRLP